MKIETSLYEKRSWDQVPGWYHRQNLCFDFNQRNNNSEISNLLNGTARWAWALSQAADSTKPCSTGRVRKDFQPNSLLVAGDRKSTRLNSSHVSISYAVFCLKEEKI